MELLLIIGSAVLVISVIIVAVVRADKKRTELLKEKAFQRGFTFTEKTEVEIPEKENLHLFNQGHSRRIVNLMQKSGQSADEMIFDYIYIIGHGKNQSVHRQTVFFFRSARLTLPGFALRPEHIFHKIGQVFGYQDIDFENYPEFSKRYILRGKDLALISRLFNQEIISLFENEKGISTEGTGNDLIIYRAGKRTKPENLFEEYEKASKICLAFQRKSDYLT